jgi:hypothetical protein
MNYFIRAIAVVAATALMAVPAWASSQQGRQTQGSQHSLIGDYIAGTTLGAVPLLQPARLFIHRGIYGRPYYGQRYYYGGVPYRGYYRGPWAYGYDWDYGYGRGPWLGYYGPYDNGRYYRGGVQVGPVGVWW